MKKHTVDFVFSLSLFMVFVICSFLLILFQINGYQKLQYDADNVYTISSYIQSEVRQNDQIDAISLKVIQDKTCLVIQKNEGISYLYLKDGYLMELYQDASMDVNFHLGNKRFRLDAWELALQEDTLHITFHKDDVSTDASLRIRSGG